MKQIRLLFLLIGFLLIFSVGCSGRDTATPTPSPIPATIAPTIPVTIAPSPAPTVTPAGGGQDVTFESSDGLTLYGTLYGGGPVAVIFSTMNGATEETWAEMAQTVAAAGYLALTYNFRFVGADGQVDNDASREHSADDLLAAIDFVGQQGAESVVLVGASLGGLAVLEVADEVAPAGVVVLAAPFDAPFFQNLRVTAEDVAAIQSPILFISSENDHAGFADDTQQLYDLAAQPKELAFYPGQAHGTELLEGPLADEVGQRLLTFLQKYAPPDGSRPEILRVTWLANMAPDLDAPDGLAVDPAGNLYIFDARHQQVVKIDPNGQLLARWGEVGSNDGQFNSLGWGGLALDPLSMALYTVSNGNSRIQKFDLEGNFILKWGRVGNQEGQFNRAIYLAVDSEGNVYVTDDHQVYVQKFDSQGQFLMRFGSRGEGDGQFLHPTGIAIDSQDNIFIADFEQDRIQKFDSAGNFLLAWGITGAEEGQLRGPNALAVDSSGRVYVTDRLNHRVQVYSGEGQFLLAWGGHGEEDGLFDFPAGIAIDNQNGYIYVSDEGNDRVQRFGLSSR